ASNKLETPDEQRVRIQRKAPCIGTFRLPASNQMDIGTYRQYAASNVHLQQRQPGRPRSY
uniref:hypothetical protein n=1 Tax=Alistipes putredinis TaxID=28117 RepID=UPI003FD71128